MKNRLKKRKDGLRWKRKRTDSGRNQLFDYGLLIIYPDFMIIVPYTTKQEDLQLRSRVSKSAVCPECGEKTLYIHKKIKVIKFFSWNFAPNMIFKTIKCRECHNTIEFKKVPKKIRLDFKKEGIRLPTPAGLYAVSLFLTGFVLFCFLIALVMI